MAELKDSGIKLFGRTIPLPAEVTPSSPACLDDKIDPDRTCSTKFSSERDNMIIDEEDRCSAKEISKDKPVKAKQEDEAPLEDSELSSNPYSTSEVINENPKAPSVEKESTTVNTSKTEEEQSEPSTSQEKTLKKPDKILPCPRCNSMDTKFCYYNNYNVNQPRHFCKNCLRYWTAGGIMRNVPVGAGRRKNKNSGSHYHHTTVSEAIQNVRTDVLNGDHHQALKTNGTVFTFGSDESLASLPNIAEKRMRNCTRNGFHKPEELGIQLTCRGGENGDNHSNGSSVTVLNSEDEAGRLSTQEPVMQNCQDFPPNLSCFTGSPWPWPWNSAQWHPPVPTPAIFPAGFPMPFYPPPAYWVCTVPGAQNFPWIPQPPSPITPSSGPNSLTLGKHSRDGNMAKPSNSGEQEQQKENDTERCIWIPKTLRIKDPSEAAKSSIWTTLGIKNEKANSIGGGGLFKAFQPKSKEKNHISLTSPVLQANPAALSRSLKFQESS